MLFVQRDCSAIPDAERTFEWDGEDAIDVELEDYH
jgi:hypothetical protein